MGGSCGGEGGCGDLELPTIHILPAACHSLPHASFPAAAWPTRPGSRRHLPRRGRLVLEGLRSFAVLAAEAGVLRHPGVPDRGLGRGTSGRATSATVHEISYNSCRNRHCPKCQALARAKWLKQREAELLPIPYFHVVFTLPAELAALALQNKRLLYGMLFEAPAKP